MLPGQSPPRYWTAALLMAIFVATCISYLVMERHGRVYVVTPETKSLHTLCFSDTPDPEKRCAHGNEAYGIVYTLWMRTMCSLYRHSTASRRAPTKGSGLARYVVESYRAIAQEVLSYDPKQVSVKATQCIDAALHHLHSLSVSPPPSSTAVWVSSLDSDDLLGYTAWFPDMHEARQVAAMMLHAFRDLSCE